MTDKRLVEIFSAGCAVCDQTVRMVEAMACASCEIVVLDMAEADVAERAETLGVRSVPAVVVDGKLAACCAGRGPDHSSLQAAGIGKPLD